ncbi:hypothetical protein DEJ27_00040 [Curtobacterium sp. MCPF17_018]|nr:hypothetical protein DEJ27_00040 [Curtobacterium sp. MCPF17_018]
MAVVVEVEVHDDAGVIRVQHAERRPHRFEHPDQRSRSGAQGERLGESPRCPCSGAPAAPAAPVPAPAAPRPAAPQPAPPAGGGGGGVGSGGGGCWTSNGSGGSIRC